MTKNYVYHITTIKEDQTTADTNYHLHLTTVYTNYH